MGVIYCPVLWPWLMDSCTLGSHCVLLVVTNINPTNCDKLIAYISDKARQWAVGWWELALGKQGTVNTVLKLLILKLIQTTLSAIISYFKTLIVEICKYCKQMRSTMWRMETASWLGLVQNEVKPGWGFRLVEWGMAGREEKIEETSY